MPPEYAVNEMCHANIAYLNESFQKSSDQNPLFMFDGQGMRMDSPGGGTGHIMRRGP
jgi:hypothetical protein